MKRKISYNQQPVSDLVEVRSSRIPGSGMGLFATCWLPKGLAIGKYEGREMPEDTPLTPKENIYAYQRRDGVTIVPSEDCLLRYANDNINLAETIKRRSRVNLPLDHNLKWHEVDKQVWLVTTREVGALEELHIDYDDDYWMHDVDSKRRKAIADKVKQAGGIDELLVKSKRNKARVEWLLKQEDLFDIEELADEPWKELYAKEQLELWQQMQQEVDCVVL